MAKRSSLISASRARRKQRTRTIRAIFILIIVAGLGYGVYWLLTAPQLQVNAYRIVFADGKVDGAVEGVLESHINELLAQPIAYIVPRTHVTAFWPMMYEQSFSESDPRIEKIDIQRTFHDATITVTLRGPYASWCMSDRTWCVAIDATGRVVDLERLDGSHATIITSQTTEPKLGDMILSQDEFVQLFTVLEMTGRVVGTPDVVNIHSINNVVVTVPGMTQLKIILDQDAAITNKYMALFAERIKSEGKTFADFAYVDLRFGNAVYYMTHDSQSTSVADDQGE